jgi:hypothetical protein
MPSERIVSRFSTFAILRGFAVSSRLLDQGHILRILEGPHHIQVERALAVAAP